MPGIRRIPRVLTDPRVRRLSQVLSVAADDYLFYDMTIGNDLNITGNITVGGTSSFTGIASFASDVSMDEDLSVTGTITGGTLTDGTASLTGGILTDAKLGSLTSNGFVKTSGGDGTLSVDTGNYLLTNGSNADSNIDISSYNFTTLGTINGINLASPGTNQFTLTRGTTVLTLSDDLTVSIPTTIYDGAGPAVLYTSLGSVTFSGANSFYSATSNQNTSTTATPTFNGIITITNDIVIDSDSYGVVLGDGQDVRIYYDGTYCKFDNLIDSHVYYVFDGRIETSVNADNTTLCFRGVILTTSNTSSYGTYTYNDVNTGSTNHTGTISCYTGNFRFHPSDSSPSGNLSLVEVYIASISSKWASSGNITDARGFSFHPNFTATPSGTITNLVGYHVLPLDGASILCSITNIYGIYIDDVSGGGALNYAIYTKAGQVSFGDVLFIRTIKSGATQAAAGAAANEIWKTASHASLPDNTLMIGV